MGWLGRGKRSSNREKRRPSGRRGPLLTDAFWQFGFEPLEARRVLSSLFLVTNTNDSGPGSLRQAIISANSAAYYGTPEIDFNISASYAVSGVFTIRPLSPLPALENLDNGITIDGRTQAEFTGDENPLGPDIVLDGSAAGSGNGLAISSSGNQVFGLDIVNFPQAGIEISGNGDYGEVGGNWIAGCYIGVDATGTQADGNGYRGVLISDGAFNVIGGTSAADRNVISGARNWEGVGIFGGDDNVVEGNYIGTDATGTNALGNEGRGVDIEQSSYNTVGGTAAGSGNVISGNADVGIGIVGVKSSHNNVQGNYIGVDSSGTAAVPNHESGVFIWGEASANWIGVGGSPARNVISGNGGDGIVISDTGTQQNLVAGNYIGTDATGTKALGNAGNGINIWGSASSNIVGGATPAARNIISGNRGDGVIISNTGTQLNSVAGNYIGTDATGTKALHNAGRGVDIEQAPHNDVGGPGNVISGNAEQGVDIYGAQAVGDRVLGNYIGIDATGEAALGNGYDGVLIWGGASSTWVGARNVISGNINGIEITGSGTDLNIVGGNYIGTDAAGMAAIPNYQDGVKIASGAAQNTIGGGSNPAAQNVISGNWHWGGGGVYVDLGDENQVIGNLIGVDATGAGKLGNWVGVEMYGAADGVVRDNVISGNGDGGLALESSRRTIVAGNRIGTDATGTQAVPNGTTETYTLRNGIGVFTEDDQSDTIGGTTSADRNIIAGNLSDGIVLRSSVQSFIEGNYIGVDASGTRVLGNGYGGVINAWGGSLTDGIALLGLSWNNTIGGTSPGAKNVISGSKGAGIALYSIVQSTEFGNISGDDRQNTIEGNYIGTDASGMSALPNGGSGVAVSGSVDNSVGGAAPGAGNVISGNCADGVRFADNAANNLVQGNLIGTNAAGTGALANSQNGVSMQNCSVNGVIGNTISGNAADGINVFGNGVPAGTMDWYQADGNVNDSVGSNNGTLQGGATFGTGVTAQPGDQAFSFNGTSSYVQFGQDIVPTGGSYSVSLFARQNAAQNGYVDLISQGAGGAGFYIGHDSNGMIRVGDGWQNTGVSFPADMQWHLFTVTVDASANQTALYVDGTLRATLNEAITSTRGGDATRLGRQFDPYGEYFNGLIDDVATFNRALSAAEVENIYRLRGTALGGAIIAGNFIGTGATGETAVPNGNWGVNIANGASGNIVGVHDSGPAAAAERNVISGNGFDGVQLAGQGTEYNVVAGNLIGTDASGNTALGNYWGVKIDAGAAHNLIGTNADGVADDLERNVISGNRSDGVFVIDAGTQNNTIAGNYIGTDLTGTAALPNALRGVFVYNGASDNTIGGLTDTPGTGAGNVISGNSFQVGLVLQGAGTSGNRAMGNIIGLDKTGRAALGNGAGVWTDTPFNIIGGTVPEARNIISGNLSDGVMILGGAATQDVVEGNYIGTDVSGEVALGNAADGIRIFSGASGNVIGGSSPAARNVISANGWQGVDILQAGTNNNVVAGNYIGTDATGTNALGNRNDGVAIWSGAQDNIVGTTGDGTADAAEQNIISGNGNHGVEILQSGTNNNVVAGNLIGTDVSGTQALGNQHDGIAIWQGAQDNRVGTNGDGISDSLERNVISANGWQGVDILQSGTNNNIVAGNYIGVDATGAKALGNHNDGVTVWQGAQDNLIGATGAGAADAAEKNVISANGNNGVEIIQAGTENNVIAGNYIGIDATGTAALGNATRGVTIGAGATNNTVGGTTPTARNVISGNGWEGVAFDGASGNTLESNYIGTNADGIAPLPNTLNGVVLHAGASNNVIGAPGAGNVISGNDQSGIALFDSTTTANTIEGNLIGTNAAGMAPLGNLFAGIGIVADASHNIVGGTVAGEGNTIAFNGNDGVLVDTGTQNLISENSVFSNGHLGIELANGGNNNQAAPVLTSITSGGGTTTVTGSVSGAVDTTFTLEFFADPTGLGQGQTFLTTANVTTDASGTASFTLTFPLSLPADEQVVTATATDASNNTSQFSNDATAAKVASFVVEKGLEERSYIRYLDITFNVPAATLTLDASHVKLEHFALDGVTFLSDVDLTNKIALVDQVMQIDFGAGGIGGQEKLPALLPNWPKLILDDGYYKLIIDPDGTGQHDFEEDFYRLFGDVIGNRIGGDTTTGTAIDPSLAYGVPTVIGQVTAADLSSIIAAVGQTGPLLNADINGSGAVTLSERYVVLKSLGRDLAAGLHLDD